MQNSVNVKLSFLFNKKHYVAHSYLYNAFVSFVTSLVGRYINTHMQI